jgi:hypothetical protein
VQISKAAYGPKWPFRVPSGTLTCAGDDYEVWFTASDGTRYALSGSAMARSLLTPRAESIRAGNTPGHVWTHVMPILNQGMLLCGRKYAAAN